MNNNVLNFEVVDNRTFKEKAQAKWYEFTGKVKQAGKWVAEHPVETGAIIMGTVAVGKELRLGTDRLIALHDDHVSRTTIYCNDVQGRVRLRHELNYKENLQLRNLMNQGFTKFEALSKMGLLK